MNQRCSLPRFSRRVSTFHSHNFEESVPYSALYRYQVLQSLKQEP
jgi:hypothetical protein